MTGEAKTGARIRPIGGSGIVNAGAGGEKVRAAGGKGFAMLGNPGSHGRSQVARVPSTCAGVCIVDTWTRMEGPLEWGASDLGLIWSILHDSTQDSWTAEVDGRVGILGLHADTENPGQWASWIEADLLAPAAPEDPVLSTDTTEVWLDVRLTDIPAAGNVQVHVGMRGDQSTMYLSLFPIEDIVGVEGGDYTPWGTQEATAGFDWAKTIHIHAKREPDGAAMLLSANFWQSQVEPEGWMVYDHQAGGIDTVGYFFLFLAQNAYGTGNGPTTVAAHFDCLAIRQACPA